MGSSQHQSPFAESAVPTPEATGGDQGIGGGLDPGGGMGAATQSPFSQACVPTPSNLTESGPFGNPSRFSSLEGSSHQGEGLSGEITPGMNRTVDKR